MCEHMLRPQHQPLSTGQDYINDAKCELKRSFVCAKDTQ